MPPRYERDLATPPIRGTDRGAPSMAEGDQSSVAGMMRQLAGRGGEGGGGGEAQSAQMVMQGAQMLMQAAQMNPALAPFVQQAIEIIRGGVQSLAGGGAGGPPPPPTRGRGSPRPRRSRKPEGEEGGMSEEAMM